MTAYDHCVLCPRRCGTKRGGGRAYCGEGAELRIAAALLHRGEEPPLTGRGGSGTIFITGCTLGCVFCQNWQISQNGMGAAVSEDDFVRICLTLQERGAENINLVTGTHAAPALASGLRNARERGLTLPVLWNSSAYESLEALSLLEDTVDLYLPDLKTLDRETAGRFFHAPDYPERAEAAILKMAEMRGKPVYAGNSLIRGVMVRHLVLPDHLESTRRVLRWFADWLRDRALFSLMFQYTPSGKPGNSAPRRCISREEYETVLAWLEEFDIADGFYQELVSDKDWLPDFYRTNPFSSALSEPVWHWRRGFV
jgi:putative pyruvate formate lyase activating enzyme